MIEQELKKIIQERLKLVNEETTLEMVIFDLVTEYGQEQYDKGYEDGRDSGYSDGYNDGESDSEWRDNS